MQEKSDLKNFVPEFGDMPKEDFRKFDNEMIGFMSNYFQNIERFLVLSQNA
jgi:hypothetical protein